MNQQEFELIADTIHGEFYTEMDNTGELVDGIEEDTVLGLIEAFAQSLAGYKTFDRDKFIGAALYGYDDDGFPMCPNYGAKVLPNEANRCSLCNKHKAW